MVSKLFYLLVDWKTFNFFMTEFPKPVLCKKKMDWFLYDRDFLHERVN